MPPKKKTPVTVNKLSKPRKQRQRSRKLNKTEEKALRRSVTGDTVTQRRTSRQAAPQKRMYLKPMSAVDVSIKENIDIEVVRAALGDRRAVVRRYQQAAAQRKKRQLLKKFEETGSWE